MGLQLALPNHDIGAFQARDPFLPGPVSDNIQKLVGICNSFPFKPSFLRHDSVLPMAQGRITWHTPSSGDWFTRGNHLERESTQTTNGPAVRSRL